MTSDPSVVKAIFLAAIEKSAPQERTAYLDEVCGNDPTLRRRVEALLLARDLPVPCLDSPAVGRIISPSEVGGRSEPDVPSCSCHKEAHDTGPDLGFLAPSQTPGSLGRLDHYEVLALIGKGSMGLVLRAFDGVLQRIVAVKVLAPQLATNASARQRFLREARAAASITHDHVVTIHAVAEGDSLPYLVMQLVHGQTLQEKLDRTGSLELPEILRIGMQIAEGLAAAHAQGLVHRDVKPANILLENGVERVKVADFGLARSVGNASLTHSEQIAGTPQYMSPEQANGLPLDHRSDLFSLGSVLYALATGQPPFRASTPTAVLRRVCEEKLPPLRKVKPELPDWFGALIERLHAKDPADRYQSAVEVAQVLREHLVGLQQPSPSLPSARRPRPRRGWPRLAVFAGLILAVAALGVALWLNAMKPPVSGSIEEDEQDPPGSIVPTQQRGASEELARQASAADDLMRENIPPALLATAGGGDPEKAPPQLVAVLGGEQGHTEQVITLAMSPDGKILASAGNDQTIKLWDLSSGRVLQTILTPGSGQIRSLAFSPDGKRLASAGGDRRITLWDMQKGSEGQVPAEPKRLEGHTRMITAVVFRADGHGLVSAGEDGTVRVWDLRAGKTVGVHSSLGKLFSLASSPDGEYLAAGGDSAQTPIHLWKNDSDTDVVQPAHAKDFVNCMAFHPDSRTLVSNSYFDRSLRLWDVTTAQRKGILYGHGREGAQGVAWRRDGQLLASAGVRDGTVRLWDFSASPVRVQTIRLYPPDFPGHVHAVAFTPEGRYLATANPDGTVYILKLARRGEVFHSSDQDREVAEWVLSVGGWVRAEQGSQSARIEGRSGLPNEPFVLAEVNLNGCNRVSNGDLERFVWLTGLTHLHLERTPITDGSLVHLMQLKGLKILNLKGTQSL